MKESLIPIIHCPACFSSDLSCEKIKEDDQEIIQGNINCSSCARSYLVNDGLVFLYDVLSQEVLLERSAAEADDLATTPFDKRLQRMEEVSHGNAISFLEKHISSAQRILELGAANGWLSAEFAIYRQAVALDMYYRSPRGLEAARELMNNKKVFFERVVADMTDLPFIDESFDLVFVCAALHHSSQLEKTIKEVYRILKPGGSFVLLSEPVSGLIGTKERACIAKDLEHGYHEARYSLRQWLSALTKQSFSTKFYLPENIAEIIKNKGFFGPFLERVWRFLPIYFRSILARPILTIFDGFFNVVAIKKIKR